MLANRKSSAFLLFFTKLSTGVLTLTTESCDSEALSSVILRWDLIFFLEGLSLASWD